MLGEIAPRIPAAVNFNSRPQLGYPKVFIPFKPQIVTSRNAVITSKIQGTLGGNSFVRNEARLLMRVGNQPVSQLQFGVGTFFLTNTGETPFSNAFNQEFAPELTSPVAYQYANFGVGVNVQPLPVNLPYTLTNPIGFDIPAGGTFYLRMATSVTSTSFYFPLSQHNVLGSSDTDYISNAVSSQIAGTGALTFGSSQVGVQQLALPLLTLGIPAAPMPAVIIAGDSIADGTGDVINTTTGSIGYVQRGLESAGGSTNVPVPWHAQAVDGYMQLNYTKATAPFCRSLWPFATHLLIQLGTNDIALAGSSLATLQAQITEICTAAKRTIGPYGKPLQTAIIKLLPRTTSTDSFATAANQTPIAGFTVGGTRDQYNAWLGAIAGQGLVDKVIDPNVYVEDPANHGVWLTNGTANYPTADGAHPSQAFHSLAAPAVNAWALTIAP